MSHLIKVTNRNEFSIVEFYEGIKYDFAPDVAVNVPLDAMEHIFGMKFGEDGAYFKTHAFQVELFKNCCRRFGWNSSKAEEITKYKHFLSSILFVPVVTQTVEVVASNDELPPAREQKPAKAAKPGKYAPQTDEPAEEEEVA